MGIIRIVRDPHNSSHSRVKALFSCASRLGYEGMYENAKRTGSPYWLPGGTATHKIIDNLLQKTVVQGRVLEQDELPEFLDSARKFLWMVLSAKCPPGGPGDRPSRLLTIYWMSEEEKAKLTEVQYQKFVRERMSKYINQVMNGIEAVALRCMVPSPFVRTVTADRFDGKLLLQSPRDPSIRIPVYGEIDVLEFLASGHIALTDWKTGNFNNYLQTDLYGEDQMVLYSKWVLDRYGKLPDVAYFVSLNVYRSDLQKYGPATLELPRYRVHAVIDFEEHFPELVREIDDFWTVLNFLAHPPLTAKERKEREAWQPGSAEGKRLDIKRHVIQGRLCPSIGRQCGMCPYQYSNCRVDNDEDWQEHERLQKIGNVVDPFVVLPDVWVDPLQEVLAKLPAPRKKDEADEGPIQFKLWGKEMKSRSPLKNFKFSAADWKNRGFFTAKEMIAQIRRMKAIIPVDNGVVCPCKRTERIPAFLIKAVHEFFFERETHKHRQELEGKTRSGTGELKLRDLYDSRTVRELLRDCDVEECPFRKAKNPPEE